MSEIIFSIALILIIIAIWPKRLSIKEAPNRRFTSMSEVPKDLCYDYSVIEVDGVLYEYRDGEFMSEVCLHCNKCGEQNALHTSS